MGSGIRRAGSGITDHGIRDHRPWDRDQQFLIGIRDKAVYHICGIRDENYSRFWYQESEICVQKWDQR